MKNNSAIQTVLKDVIFLEIDCEKGEGVELAKKFGIRGYPTYVMVNSEGKQTDRWIGYEGPQKWVGNVNSGLADTRTIDEKKAAYKKSPTIELTKALAHFSSSTSDYSGSVKYLRKARELDRANVPEYTGNILENLFYGLRAGAFTAEQVQAEAKQIFESEDSSTENLINVATLVYDLSSNAGEPEKAIPYIKGALKASEGELPDDLAEMRVGLEISAALLIDKDTNKATKLRRQSMPEGWQEDPSELNSFAWWCFEQNTNLEEAQELALKGAELASSDGERANILDTAADICNALDNCDEAIALIKKAIELNPDRAYFKEQLAKFESKAAENNKG